MSAVLSCREEIFYGSSCGDDKSGGFVSGEENVGGSTAFTFYYLQVVPDAPGRQLDFLPTPATREVHATISGRDIEVTVQNFTF